MNPTIFKHISDCFIKPKYEVLYADEPHYLAPIDLTMLYAHYIQQGLLFIKPSNSNDQQFDIHDLLESLKESLSCTLVRLYPLAGQLDTQMDESKQKRLIFVDCKKGPGARFIHASLDMTISDILSPTYAPIVVQSFFDHNKAINHDGHYLSLLTVKVTELLDGVFIGCSMNHAVGDETSYWHFWNIWSEIHRAKLQKLVPKIRKPIHKRWFPDGYGPAVFLPFSQPEHIVSRNEEPDQLRVRVFHFSSKSIARLKSKANEENSNNNNNIAGEISSFQALSALYWRSIIRALRPRHDQITNCILSTNNRHRLDPPLPQEYFGNCISPLKTTTTVGKLLEHNLGWAASLLHQSVANHNDKVLRDSITRWLEFPTVFTVEKSTDSYSVMIGSSPRFDVYGNEFGLGKPVAVRRGYATKFLEKVTAYPGYEGGESVDLEICLPFGSMEALESDKEFMDAVTL